MSILHFVLTFGMGNLCLTPEPTSLQMNALLLLQPMTFLALFFLLRVALSYSCTGAILQRQQQHMRLVRVMWLALVVSYFQLASVCMHILTCVPLSGRHVLGIDGTVQCFTGQHTAYGASALAILLILIVPPPLVLLFPAARRLHRLVSFIDQASSMYRDERRWWAAVSLLKRVLLAVVCTQVSEDRARLILITILFWMLLIAHYIAW